MISVEEAQARATAGVAELSVELVGIDEALGRVLAENLIAALPSPRFTNAAMDGYALHARSTTSASVAVPVALDVIGESAAGGDGELVVTRKEAARIFTGAPLPKGCDAVVMQEDVVHDGRYVLVKGPVQSGSHVRRLSEDVSPGALLARRGIVVGPGEIALAAMQGRSFLPVIRQPRVAIVPIGDELVEVDTLATSPPTKVPNCNAVMLAAQVRQAGAIPVRLPITPDQPDAIAVVLRRAADLADVIVTSGGVSAGAHDHVARVVAELGVIDFHKVAMRPGKPLAVGSVGGKRFFGLPGNPVSSFVSFELFVRPILRKMQSARDVERPVVAVRLAEPAPRAVDRRNYVRARIVRDSGTLVATPAARQGSADITSLAEVDGLLMIAPGPCEAAAGEVVPCFLLRTL